MRSFSWLLLALVSCSGRSSTPGPCELAVDGTRCGDDDCASGQAEVCQRGQCVRQPRAACTNTWVPQSIEGGYGQVMAYDSSRQRVVAFSGQRTWEWDGATWAHRTPPGSPRFGSAMAWDAARGRMVMLGGTLDEAFAQTWEWDGATWTLRSPNVSPPARLHAALAYDSSRQRVVLFGGTPTSNGVSPFSDTWEYDGTTWEQRTPATAPPARSEHALAYDSVRQRVVLFGGTNTAFTPPFFGDTWEWDGTSWLLRSPAASPGARTDTAMAFDAARQRVVLFSGYTTGAGEVADTWEWDGTTWTSSAAATAPAARIGHALAYDEARQRVVLLGGEEHSDTWEWDGATWLERTPLKLPSWRFGAAMTYDVARGRFVAVAGTPLTQTWEWDGQSDWVLRAPRTTPPMSGTLAYDEARQRVVLVAATSPSLDVWEWDGEDWAHRATATSPPFRTGFALAWDAGRQRVVLFGGFISRLSRVSQTVAIADTWEWDGSSWALQPTASTLAPRGDSAMTFSGTEQRMLLFGGEIAEADAGFETSLSEQTWARTGTSWQPQTAALSPPASARSVMAFDSARGSVVLFGAGGAGTWEWHGSTWAERQPSVSPPPGGAALIYEAARARLVLLMPTGHAWVFVP
jgi:hypothetical protein